MFLLKSLGRCASVLLACLLTACGGGDRGGTSTGSPTSPTTPTPVVQPLVIVDSSAQVSAGFEILVNTDRGRTDWLTRTSEGFQASYPSGQQFGFIAVVLSGATAPGSRPARDVSAYKTLQLELRGALGGENVEIGIKDNTDPDDGTEVKKTVALASNWQTLTFPLSDFTTADLTRLYLVCELVFNGTTGRTVFFRDIRYVP